jgi:hypothetical protein
MEILQPEMTTSESKATGIDCMAAAWMLAAALAMVATSAAAQTVYARNGLSGTVSADSTAAAGSATQDAERTGVARPSSTPITVTPYSDADATVAPNAMPINVRSSAPIVESIQPVKPSAAIPQAAPSATSVETVYGHGNGSGDNTTKVAPAKADASAPDATPKLTTHRSVAKSKVVATSEDFAVAKANASTNFDPNAEIVTEETAGRAERAVSRNVVPVKDEENEDAGIVTRVPSRPGEVPDGTLVKVKLHEDLSSLTTKAGSSFTAEVSEPVERDGQVVVPVGSMLEGRVTWVRQGRRVGNSAAIHLEPRTITLPDGSQYLLRARVIDTDRWDDTKVDNEGTILRKDHSKATEATISAATGGGMVAGAVVGGLPGALVGAGVGAGISTVVWARQDRQADLPKDLCIVFSLTEPMRITPMSAHLTRPAVGAGDAK